MKKLLALLLALLMVFSLSACDAGNDRDDDDDDDRDHSRFDRDDPTEPTEEPYPVPDALIGRWIIPQNGYDTDFTLNDDGTGSYNGQEATWKARAITQEEYDWLRWTDHTLEEIVRIEFYTTDRKPELISDTIFSIKDPNYPKQPYYGADGRVYGFLENIQPIPMNDPLVTPLVGNWDTISEKENSEFPYDDLALQADGTCTAGDASGTWTAHQVAPAMASDLYAKLALELILDGEQKWVSVSYPEAGVYEMRIDDILWLPIDHMVTVDLTTDNWDQYFEIVVTESAETDAFGDMTSVTRSWSLQCRDSYQLVVPNNFEIHFEFYYFESNYPCVFDTANNTLTITDVASFNANHTQKYSFVKNYNSPDTCTSLFFLTSSTSYVTSISEFSDFEVLRLAGNTTVQLVAMSK